VDVVNAGLEERLSRDWTIDSITSVASFFVSRIDSLVDPLLEKVLSQGNKKSEVAAKVKGQGSNNPAHY
jgi:transaldolase